MKVLADIHNSTVLDTMVLVRDFLRVVFIVISTKYNRDGARAAPRRRHLAGTRHELQSRSCRVILLYSAGLYERGEPLTAARTRRSSCLSSLVRDKLSDIHGATARKCVNFSLSPKMRDRAHARKVYACRKLQLTNFPSVTCSDFFE